MVSIIFYIIFILSYVHIICTLIFNVMHNIANTGDGIFTCGRFDEFVDEGGYV